MTNSLAIYNQFDALEKAATALQKSGYFKDVTSQAQAIVKVMAGAELGLPPFASMSGIHIIQGKPVLGANILATLVKNDPRYNYQIKRCDNTACELTWFEDGKLVGTSSFTIEEAKAAGLTGKDNWVKYPSDMLFARAISRGARRFAPGVFGGSPVYTPDEMGQEVDPDGYIDATAKDVTEQPAPEQPEPEEPPAETPPTPAKPERPYSPSKIKTAIEAKAKKHADFVPTKGQQNLLRYVLELCFAGQESIEDKRHTLLKYLTGQTSTNKISGNVFKAIVEDWLKVWQDTGEDYHIDEMAAREANQIVIAALVGEGQQSFMATQAGE